MPNEKEIKPDNQNKEPEKLPKTSITRINPSNLPIGKRRHIEIFGQNFLNTTNVVISQCDSSSPAKINNVNFYHNKLDVYITVPKPQDVTLKVTLTDQNGKRYTFDKTYDGKELQVTFYEPPKKSKFPLWKKLLIGFGMIAVISVLLMLIKSCQHQPEIISHTPDSLQAGVVTLIEITTSQPLNLEGQHSFSFPDSDVLLLKVVTEEPKKYQLKVQPLATCQGNRSVFLNGTKSFATFTIFK